MSDIEDKLPEDWKLKTIDDLSVRVGSGVTPRGGSEVYTHEGVLFVRSQNVHFNGLDLSDVAYIDQKTHDSMQASEIFPQDVLFNITGASIGRCCTVPDGIGLANVNQHVCSIRLSKPCAHDAMFLSTVLSSFIGQNQVLRFNAGGNREGLNYQQLRSFQIPWPPGAQRKVIAEILSTVDRAIEQTEAAIAKQQRIKTGLMQDLLTRGIDEHGNLRSAQTHQFKDSPLGRIPVEWEVKTLNSCVKDNAPICYGILMPGTGYDNGIPVIKVKDIIGGRIIQKSLLLTDPRIDREYKRSKLKQGDLLITIRGTTGRIALVPLELNGANITQDTARVRLKNEHSNSFFYFLMQSKGVQDQVLLHTLGQAVKGINIAEVKKIAFGLPGKDEQIEVADRLNELEGSLSNTERRLQKLCSLKAALMQDLLRGKKRVTSLLE